MKRKKFCVIGLGFFGASLAESLAKAGAEVLAIDDHQEKIDRISDKVDYAVAMDSTDKKALASLGLEEMDAAIVAIGEGFESSITTTAHLQELGVKKIYPRITSEVHERLLKLMDVGETLLPEADAAKQLTVKLMVPGVIQSFRIGGEYGIFEIQAPARFIGKTLIETNMRKEYNLNLVTIKRPREKTALFSDKSRKIEEVLGVPRPKDKIEEGDVLVIFGRLEDVKNLLEVE